MGRRREIVYRARGWRPLHRYPRLGNRRPCDQQLPPFFLPRRPASEPHYGPGVRLRRTRERRPGNRKMVGSISAATAPAARCDRAGSARSSICVYSRSFAASRYFKYFRKNGHATSPRNSCTPSKASNAKSEACEPVYQTRDFSTARRTSSMGNPLSLMPS
jgi:hypothetical protein